MPIFISTTNSVPCLPTSLVRTLYEEQEQESFHESLEARIKGHERDIEKMCNKNYQGFIESVSELLKVKSDAMKLKVSRCQHCTGRIGSACVVLPGECPLTTEHAMTVLLISLQRKVQEANHTIQDTGQQVAQGQGYKYYSGCHVLTSERVSVLQLMMSAAELHHSRQVQRNILSTVEALGLCIPGESIAIHVHSYVYMTLCMLVW